MHEPLGGWGQVQGGHDVNNVTQLGLAGNGLDLVNNQLPLPICSLSEPIGQGPEIRTLVSCSLDL